MKFNTVVNTDADDQQTNFISREQIRISLIKVTRIGGINKHLWATR